jgi:CubicO group peptidase (beta-lactamase class C family)
LQGQVLKPVPLLKVFKWLFLIPNFKIHESLSPDIIPKMDTKPSFPTGVRPGLNPASKRQMKLKILFLLLAFTLAACQPASASAAPAVNPPLRDDPSGQIIADLEASIPDRMAQGNIPGLTIALIQDNRIVWTEGYGVANTLNGQPMQADSVFEVASLSKVVGAYTALQMLSDGQLNLDEPVYDDIPPNWNPGTPYDAEVTLRDLMSHSAGIFNRGEATPPGETFYYTGYGYARVQRVIQNKSERDLEGLAREYTLDPLGMSSTNYTSPESLQPRLSNGHIQASYPILRFLAPAIVFFIAIMIGLLVLIRIWKKKWLCPSTLWFLAAGGSTVITLFSLSYAYRWTVPKMGRLITLSALVFETLLAVFIFVGWKNRERIPAAWQPSPRRQLAFAAYILVSMALLIGLSNVITIPTPKEPTRFPSAASSMWASASDLATLMIEINHPQHLAEDVACEMCTPQISINPDLSWGLGIGIQHSEYGDSLWHTGVHFDFNTLVVIYPESGNGVVILTNTNSDQAALRDIAQLALGGKADWEIPRDVQSSSFMPEGGGE